MNFYLYFLLFIIYSFTGWIIEVICVSLIEKRFVNRGFMIGPYCPIYGVGGLASYLLLTPYYKRPFVLFLVAIVIFTILEYSTSYLMEKMFKARWWDYSDKKYHINGRVSLDTMFQFGLLGSFSVYISTPFLLEILNNISSQFIFIIFSMVFLMFIIDLVISIFVILKFVNNEKCLKKDSTETINKKVRMILKDIFTFKF